MDGQTFEFEYHPNNGKIADKQTGSEWNLDGKGIDDKMKGRQLTRLALQKVSGSNGQHSTQRQSYTQVIR